MKYINELTDTIQKIAVPGKGILAADESTPTITKRFEAEGIQSTEQSRRDYREMLLTTPHANQYIAGVILFEETLNQKMSDGTLFPVALKKLGILPGIKVDKGLVALPGTQDEKVTQGLEGLGERLDTYREQGAVFAKWRAVYDITATKPSQTAIDANADALAQYAAICQQHGIVPIVEPEILIDGDHTLERCEAVSVPVFKAVFDAMKRHNVSLKHIILKPSMVISGKTCANRANVKAVAEATVRVLKQTVPSDVPTINFLSGGQSQVEATAHLNAMHQLGALPWNVSFSYARALQTEAMKLWKGQAANVLTAQKAFYKRAKLNSLASMGKYTDAMEAEEVSFA